MTDRKRRSWVMKMPGWSKVERGGASLISPKQSEDLTIISPSYSSPPPSLSRTSTIIDDAPTSRPSTPKRWSLSLTPSFPSNPKPYPQDADQQSSPSIPERPSSQQQSTPSRPSFSRMSFSSVMGGLSSLSLTRTMTSTDKSNGDDDKKEKESRGRSLLRGIRTKSASQAPDAKEKDASSRSRSRARSQSPFMFRRSRNSESSPIPQPIPLAQSDADLSDSSAVHHRPTSFADEPESETDVDTEDEDKMDEISFDTVTERNTEQNAQVIPDVHGIPDVEEPDPLGEGVNVVVPHEPYFPTSLNPREGSARGKRGAKRRKSLKHEPLPLHTARPRFERDRCTTTLTQGDPEDKRGGRNVRRYMVASDLGEESRYALEWGIGTVLRDGDELVVVHIIENESKVDPPISNAADRALKLRRQQERQGFAFILVRQSTSLLQRTKLNVKVVCQAWHAKNARRMLLDIADYYEPTMLIVGSRGLGQLSGILLGSTSHYLIQKCSVPVMVARRRLKRPPKKSAHLNKNRVHKSLVEAALIDSVAAKVDEDVKTMRDEIQRAEEERHQERTTGLQPSMRETHPTIAEEAEGDMDEGEEEDEVDDIRREIKVG